MCYGTIGPNKLFLRKQTIQTKIMIMQRQMSDSDRRPTHDEIAKLAYSIFEKSGRVPGRDQQNWFEAERQLTSAGRKQVQTKSTGDTGSRAPRNGVIAQAA
jgi:Protein of unknown function (DUF2934)